MSAPTSRCKTSVAWWLSVSSHTSGSINQFVSLVGDSLNVCVGDEDRCRSAFPLRLDQHWHRCCSNRWVTEWIPIIRRPLFLLCMDSSMLSRHWRDVYPVRQLQSVGLLRCGARWFSLWGWSEALRPHTDHIHGWSVLVPSPSNTISSCCFVVQTVAVVFCVCSALMASILRITTSSIYHHAVICYFLFTTEEALWCTSY